MPKLTEEVQTFIVTELACFRTSTQIVDLVKEEFGLVISKQAVDAYRPGRAGRKPAKQWIARFEATRKAFLEEKAGIAITHRAYRQRELQDIAQSAKRSKNYRLALAALEQAAKEEGEMFTNHAAKAPVAQTDEQRVATMRAMIMDMDARTVGEPMTPPSLGLVQGNGS